MQTKCKLIETSWLIEPSWQTSMMEVCRGMESPNPATMASTAWLFTPCSPPRRCRTRRTTPLLRLRGQEAMKGRKARRMWWSSGVWAQGANSFKHDEW